MAIVEVIDDGTLREVPASSLQFVEKFSK